MPGLLSSVFDAGGVGGEEGGSVTETQATDATLDLTQDIDLDVAIEIGLETGGSYQELDGSTTTWSNEQTIGLDADVDGTVGAILSAGTDQTTYEG